MVSSRVELTASDGLRARDNGEWGKQKLAFLAHFAPVALTATARKSARHFVDLFAGPGINKLRGTNEEFDGSPLQAITTRSDRDSNIQFTHAVFVNRDRRDHEALALRIAGHIADGRSRMDAARVQCIRGDANVEIYPILEAIDPRAYIFAFADMEAPRQCAWNTIAALRTYRKHMSVDLYMLFPLDMALKRLISFNPRTTAESAPALTRFYGTDAWRELLTLRESSSASNRAELGRRLQSLYVDRLRTLWRYVDEICDVRRGMQHRMYKMLYASDHVAGKSIAAWAKRRSTDQFDLL